MIQTQTMNQTHEYSGFMHDVKQDRGDTAKLTLPIPPMDGLHDISPTVSIFCVTRTVRAPDFMQSIAR